MAARKGQYKKSEASKRAILDAARKLAQERGYDKTSIRDIARESGLSVGAFYHHFEGKDAVLSESFLQFDGLLTEEAFARYDAMAPLAAVRAVLLEQTAFTERIGASLMREYYRALLQGKNRAAVDPQRRYYRAVRRYVERAQAEGALKPGPEAGAIAEYLVKSVRGALLDWCLHDGGYPAARRVEAELDWYLLPFLA